MAVLRQRETVAHASRLQESRASPEDHATEDRKPEAYATLSRAPNGSLFALLSFNTSTP